MNNYDNFFLPIDNMEEAKDFYGNTLGLNLKFDFSALTASLSLSATVPTRVPIAATAKAIIVAMKRRWMPCCATAATKAATTNLSKT